MSLGAIKAGVKVALAVEADCHAATTYAKNHPGTVVFQDDIRSLTDRKINNIRRGSNGTVVFGGPPCQGFSYSNSRTRRADNPDNWLFQEFIRVVRVWEPDIVVFENVQGIVDTADGMFLQHVLGELERLKYVTVHKVLNAVDHGVAQDRARLFVLATRCPLSPRQLPNSRRGKQWTVRDAIGDLPELKNGASANCLPYQAEATSAYARRLRGRRTKSMNHLVTRNAPLVVKRYRFVPPGGNWSDIPAQLMRNYEDRFRCHTGIYHRLRPDEPSVVIGNYRKNMLIHPEQDRGLSVREAARIQSFPDWYEFMGSIGFQQQQVGNAVPPLLAEAVFRRIV